MLTKEPKQNKITHVKNEKLSLYSRVQMLKDISNKCEVDGVQPLYLGVTDKYELWSLRN